MSNRGWLLAAVLLVSGGPLGGQEGKESPIGAWVTNVDEPTGPGPPRNVQADSGDRQVRAHNRVGYGEPDSVAAAPANEPPKCTGPETKRLAENGSRQIGTYTCTDPGDAITWILKGAQADSLELRPLSPPQAARRTLAFRNIPNYELRSRYDAWVIGRDRGGLSDTVEVTVTVTDSLDDGVVTVSNPNPVRAHNRVGAGSAASAEVAPAGGPGPATLAADPGDRQAPNGAEVKLYRYRYRTASGWTGRDWHRVAGKGAARDTTLTGLSNGTLYTFEVRAKTGRAAASP